MKPCEHFQKDILTRLQKEKKKKITSQASKMQWAISITMLNKSQITQSPTLLQGGGGSDYAFPFWNTSKTSCRISPQILDQ